MTTINLVILFSILLLIFAIVFFVRNCIKDIADMFWAKFFENKPKDNEIVPNNTVQNTSSTSNTSLTGNDMVPKFGSDRDFDYFKRGIDYSFTLTNMVLYRMFIENTILDYDSLNDEMKKILSDFGMNQGIMVKWNKEYLKYANEKYEREQKEKELLGKDPIEPTSSL